MQSKVAEDMWKKPIEYLNNKHCKFPPKLQKLRTPERREHLQVVTEKVAKFMEMRSYVVIIFGTLPIENSFDLKNFDIAKVLHSPLKCDMTTQMFM